MSNVEPATLQDLMDEINTLVSNDSDTPTSSNDSDEWTARLNLIYLAIKLWGNTQDVLWKSLWSTFTGAATLSGTTTYSLSTLTDYRFTGGYLRLTLNGVTTYVPFIKPEEARTYIDGGTHGAYITGNNYAGLTLNLTWTPTSGDGTFGASFVFDYYKYPFKPTATTDKVEMADPNYIVFWVAAQKALLESQNNKYGVYDSQATECMDNMRVMNSLVPYNQYGQVAQTDDLHGAVLGE